jgi:hypothetical protein
MIKLVIKLENIEQIKPLLLISSQNNIQKEFGKKVAQNFYNFMVSFHKEYFSTILEELFKMEIIWFYPLIVWNYGLKDLKKNLVETLIL